MPTSPHPADHTSVFDPALGVAPTLAVLVHAWGEADADACARWIAPLLPRLVGTDGGDADSDTRLAVEARRAEQAATHVVALAAAVRRAGSGLDGLLAGFRRRGVAARGSAVARFDGLCATLAETELAAQTAFHEARMSRALATVASRPTAATAREQLAVQAHALGRSLTVRPTTPAPADATPAWADAWSAEDPRAGAACFAVGHAAQVIRVALGTPDVRTDAVHAAVAALVERMVLEDEAPVRPAAPVAAADTTADAPAPAFTPAPPVVADARFDAARDAVVLTLSTGATVLVSATRLVAALDLEA